MKASNNLLKSAAVILVFAVVSALALTACTKGNNSKSALVELKFMLFGEKPNHMDEVLEEFNKAASEKINTRLSFEWSAINDHKQKLKLKMAAGEEVDAVFDAPWVTMQTMISQGSYISLDDYFNNDKYKGLKKAFSGEIVESNKFFGYVYGIPFMRHYANVENIITIRKDLREKYGFKKIESEEELAQFYQTILEKEKNIIPLAVNGRRGFFKMFSTYFDKTKANIYPVRVASSSGFDFEVALSPDNKKVLGAVVAAGNVGYGGLYGGDSAEMYAGFPEPWNKPDTYKMSKHVEWNRFLEKDSLVQKDANGLFISGKAASIEGQIPLDRIKDTLNGAEGEYFVYQKELREMQPKAVPSDYRANNFVCIPVTSKNADRTMQLFDFIYANEQYHDLLEYGIKDKHWIDMGENRYKLPDGFNASTMYNFPGYQLTWTPTMIKYNVNLTEEEIALEKYRANPQSAYIIPTAGFDFNQEPVKSEIAKIIPVYQNIYEPLLNGLYKDTVEKVREANKKAVDMGLEKVRAEVIKQMQEFLDKKYQ